MGSSSTRSSLNQNLLHETTSLFATQAEALVLSWLAPCFGMQGGHFCAGSTIANLTGIWAARDVANDVTGRIVDGAPFVNHVEVRHTAFWQHGVTR